MSNEIFPANLPGIKWDISRSTGFKTSIYEALSGAERRIRHRPVSKRRVELSYEVLRESRAYTELQTLQAFYTARSGSFDSFLFHDQYDGQASNVQYGTGDGMTASFQLARSVGNVLEAVHNPEVGAFGLGQPWFPSAAQDAVFWPEPSGVWPRTNSYEPSVQFLGLNIRTVFTLNANGLVTFSRPPPSGAVLEWSGRYYHRARFADDTFTATEFMKKKFSVSNLAIVLSLQNIL